jgi:hypothetical protein
MNTTTVPYVRTDSRLWVSDELADLILHHPDSTFSCGANPSAFRNGDYCYFGKTSYNMRGCTTNYLAHLAIRRFVGWNADGSPVEHNFYVVAVSGSYGFGGLQQATRYTMSDRVKKQIYHAAELIFEGKFL